jgi:hypothetical protein
VVALRSSANQGLGVGNRTTKTTVEQILGTTARAAAKIL